MYLADYHSHTRCSPDSSAPLEAMAQAALDVGLQSLCVTDHCDLLDGEGKRTFSFDWAPLLEQFNAAAPKFAGKLDLRLGLEFGSAQVDADAAHAILDRPELDFVIGSLHNRSEAEGGEDFYYGRYTTSAFCHATLDDYFSSMAALVSMEERYDVLGHIIYPLRYMARDGQTDITLKPYLDRLRGILRTAVERGRGIEINTWCGRTVEGWREVLAVYRDCGGEILTIGSDAHAPENVGKGLREAQALLRDMGFRYFTAYRRRRPEFIKL